VDPGTEARQQLHERVVLALREGEVDWMDEPVRRILERGTKRRAGTLDQHVGQGRRHALRAKSLQVGHPRRIRAAAGQGGPPDARSQPGLGGRPGEGYAPPVAGYAASGRLHGVVPRFVGTDPGFGDPVRLAGTGASEPVVPDNVVQVDLVGRPIDETIRDWLASIGESWSQLTFFLFDPDSWR